MDAPIALAPGDSGLRRRAAQVLDREQLDDPLLSLPHRPGEVASGVGGRHPALEELLPRRRGEIPRPIDGRPPGERLVEGVLPRHPFVEQPLRAIEGRDSGRDDGSQVSALVAGGQQRAREPPGVSADVDVGEHPRRRIDDLEEMALR
jgi:hypothetical protein